MTPPEVSHLRYRITGVPTSGEDPRRLRARVLTALSLAHGTDQPLTMAWVRSQSSGIVRVMVGGVQAAGGQVSFPGGCEAAPLTDADGQALQALTWAPVPFELDAAGAVAESFGERLEDLFAYNPQPMAFLVHAVPASDEEVAETAAGFSRDAARQVGTTQGMPAPSTKQTIERATANHNYLQDQRAVGCWRLQVWAADSTAPAAVGAALAGTADIAESVLRPALPTDPRDRPLVVGCDAVGALLRPPFVELPGTRLLRRAEFDSNVESGTGDPIGRVLGATRLPVAHFGLTEDAINRHVFVCGATGSGKSETVRRLLASLSSGGVPWLVIEPAKAEYASLASRLARPTVIIRPGDPQSPPAMLNPLEPSSIVVDGVRHFFPLQTHLDLVRALFTASFEAEEPFPQVLGAGLTAAYRARGFDLITGAASDPTLAPPTWPTLSDLVRESLEVVNSLGYGSEVRNNVRGFIKVRVESLRTGTPGRFFEGGFEIDLDALLASQAIIEIEDVGDDRDKAFVIGTLIVRLVEWLRLRQQHGRQPHGLAHVTVIEEAHRLLRRVPDDSPAAHAVAMFANLLAEVRAYGEGIVVAEQIPSKVIVDVIKNSAVKLMHRLPALDDRMDVGATMNLDAEQSAEVVALEPGRAAAHVAGMDRPVIVDIESVAFGRPWAPPLAVLGIAPTLPRLGRRAGTCDSCNANPCSVSEISAAANLVTPALSLWVECVTVAHLTGDQLGNPSGVWGDRLRAALPHQRRCALAQAAAASCQRRGPLIRTWHHPDSFAEHLTSCLQTQIVGAQCQGGWAMGQFRFSGPGEVSAASLALMEASPKVRSWDLAGSPPTMPALAEAMGFRAESPRIALGIAVTALGLDPLPLLRRIDLGGAGGN
jgi:uncharacterized protein